MPRLPLRAAIGLSLGLAVAVACHANDDGSDDVSSAGAACEVAYDCYPDADHDAIVGEVQCLDRVPGGYCTHLCSTDADCCAVQGECDGRPQVCAPFESTGAMMCFLSCEDADLDGDDPDAYCHQYAADAFTCRSTGGGSDNRKVCA